MRIQAVMRRYAALRTMLCEHGIRPHAAFDPAATRNACELKMCNAQQAPDSNGHFAICATCICSQCSDSTHIVCVSRNELAAAGSVKL